MAGLSTTRIPMREERLRLENLAPFAEGLWQPVRFPSVPVNITPAWPD